MSGRDRSSCSCGSILGGTSPLFRRSRARGDGRSLGRRHRGGRLHRWDSGRSDSLSLRRSAPLLLRRGDRRGRGNRWNSSSRGRNSRSWSWSWSWSSSRSSIFGRTSSLLWRGSTHRCCHGRDGCHGRRGNGRRCNRSRRHTSHLNSCIFGWTTGLPFRRLQSDSSTCTIGCSRNWSVLRVGGGDSGSGLGEGGL